MTELQREWVIIHSDIEKYEQFTLIIKLFSVLICLLCFVYTINPWLNCVLLLTLWLQDGIWKTFQQRSTVRVLQIEEALKCDNNATTQAFQLYSEWLAQRQGAIALIREYITTSLKPTVAYPYIVLVITVLAANLTVNLF